MVAQINSRVTRQPHISHLQHSQAEATPRKSLSSLTLNGMFPRINKEGSRGDLSRKKRHGEREVI
jgi:hypothetical protein